jgi:sugar phosphate isomerase/epimerase
MELDRRAFLSDSSRAVAGLGLLSLGACCTSEEKSPVAHAPQKSRTKENSLFQISLAQWSFHVALGRGKSATMDNLEFAREASELGFAGVEYVNQFFKDKAKDAKYIAEMNKVASDSGIRNLLIMCDGEGRLGDPDANRRRKAIENHYRWVDAAKELGCHSIRVNAASKGSYDEQLKLAADGLRRLTEFGAQNDMNVIVENHGGLSSNGAWLSAVMREVDHPRCGTLPDFGNFRLGGGKEYNRYKGVRELMPFAKAVSAKSHDFDEKGNETRTDYMRMMRVVLDANYRGFVGVEYEGKKLSERDGIIATKKLLERVRDVATREGW